MSPRRRRSLQEAGSTSRWKVWLTRLSLLVVGVLLAGTSLELAVRVFRPMNLDFYNWQKIKRVSQRPGQEFELIPGAHSDFYEGVPVTINQLGLRDAEIAIPKPTGTVRILGIGDSVAFGYGVPLSDTYLKVLESDLNGDAAGARHYEVVNAGMEATGLDYYYRFLESSAAALEPDLVLVGITLNDIADYHHRGTEPDARAFSDRSLIRRVNTFLLFHSQAYFSGYVSLKSLLYRSGVVDFNQEHWSDIATLQPPSPEQREAWDSSREMLANITTSARNHGYPLVFVVFPMEVQLDQRSLELYQHQLHLAVTTEALRGVPQEEVLRFGAASGVPVVDLLPAFRAAGSNDLFLRGRSMSADPVHPSPNGHHVAGHELFRFLKQESSLTTIIRHGSTSDG